MNSVSMLLCRRKFLNKTLFSTVKQTSLKESRAERLKELNKHQTKGQTFTPFRLGSASLLVGLTLFAGSVVYYPEGECAKFYKDSLVSKIVARIREETVGRFDEMMDPTSTKLIPDWPTAPCYGNPPPGSPAPPLLVLDLERTLIASVHDTRYGWRHVKRPGLDRFINSLSNYYEIVIFSENDANLMQETLSHIDPEGKCHKLGNTAGEVRGGGSTVLKRLDYMNRDLAKIILIDDSAEASGLFPRNTLLVKPFVDVNDKSDTVLLELLPLLQAFVHDDSRDFRDSIDNLGTHEAEEAAVEYRMRVAQKKAEREAKRNRGLGGYVRSTMAKVEEPDEFASMSRILSPSQIVGAAPPGPDTSKPTEKSTASIPFTNGYGATIHEKKGPSVKKKSAVFEWLDSSTKERESEVEIKQQRMNEIYQQREMAKARARQQAMENSQVQQ